MTTSVVTSKGPRPFLEQWRDAVSGSTAGMVSVLALHPLDVIKTRLQGASPTLNRTDTFLHSAAARDPEPSSPNVRPIPPRLPLHSPRSHRVHRHITFAPIAKPRKRASKGGNDPPREAP